MESLDIVRLGDILTESKIESSKPNVEKRIRVLLNAKGVVQRPIKKETKGATKYFIRKKGQFIYGKQNIHKGAFGIVPDELDGFESTSDLPAFDVDHRCLPVWIDYYLKQGDFYLSLLNIARGAATKRVQPKEFLQLKIPLPTVEEQREIVDHFKSIETEDAELKAELTHQQTLLKKLRQQILQEAIEGKLTANWRENNPDVEPASELLTRIQAEKAQLIKDKKIKKQKPLPPISEEEKPFALPDGWVWCWLNDLIYENPRNGYSPKTVDFPTTTKTLKLGATTSGVFVESEIKYINEEIEEESFLWLKSRDILIQRGNSIDFVGVSAIYNGESNKFVYPDLMMKLKPVASISEVYLHHALMSPYCREYFRGNATGAQKSMPKINQGVVSSALIPLCSEAEQKAIVIKVEKLLALCDQLESHINHNQSHAENLMQAVLKEAFTANTDQRSKPAQQVVANA